MQMIGQSERDARVLNTLNSSRRTSHPVVPVVARQVISARTPTATSQLPNPEMPFSRFFWRQCKLWLWPPRPQQESAARLLLPQPHSGPIGHVISGRAADAAATGVGGASRASRVFFRPSCERKKSIEMGGRRTAARPRRRVAVEGMTPRCRLVAAVWRPGRETQPRQWCRGVLIV